MLTVRPISHDSAEQLGVHLRRLGLDERDASGREAAPWAALVTGAGPDVPDLLRAQAAGLQVVPGDARRAPDALILCGTRGQARALADRLRPLDGEAGALARAIDGALESAACAPPPTQIGRRRFDWGSRTFVMGVVNVTPDSFSDGGRYFDCDAAVAHGEQLAAEGADLLDVGGESTRPGATPVSAEEELSRVVPVIERLSRLTDVPISIDTTKAVVAQAAVRAGASLVNDISGFGFDPEMAPTVGRLGVCLCLQHTQGDPRTMQLDPRYQDLVGEVIDGLRASMALAERSGVARERIVVDPGIGFGKTLGHNLFLLRQLAQLKTLGRPILVGASRKGFIGKLTGRTVDQRLPGSLAAHLAAVLHGADLVRVHEVADTVAAVRVVDAIRRAEEGGSWFGDHARG